jgi:hypothetical protein
MRWGIGIAAAVVALLVPAQVAGAELRLGMAFKYLTNQPTVTGPVDNAAPSLDAVSLDLGWATVQRGCGSIRRGEFFWDRPDYAMEYIRGTGLPVSLSLTAGPPCTSPGPGMEPRGKWMNKWLRFVRATVNRYGSDPVVEFEIFPEPNLHRFGGNARIYKRFFLATERAIRGADPGVRTLVGGLGFCCEPERFARQLYSSKKMRKRGRHLALHTYSPTPAAAIAGIRRVRRELPKGGDLTITEHGWSTCPRPTKKFRSKCVTPARQAAQMSAYLRLLERNDRKLRLRGFYWFQSQDDASPEKAAPCRTSPKHFYGIWTRAGAAKPSLAVWEEATGVDLPDAVPENPFNRPCRD